MDLFERIFKGNEDKYVSYNLALLQQKDQPGKIRELEAFKKGEDIEIDKSMYLVREDFKEKYWPSCFSKARIEEYSQEKWVCCVLGIHQVDVDNIIGFSRATLKGIRLDNLKESIKENGWSEKIWGSGATFWGPQLLVAPDGKLCIDGDGNHRTYVAKKIGVKSFKAEIQVFIPHGLITKEEFEMIEGLEKEYDDIDERYHHIYELLKSVVIREGLAPGISL